jgi:catechol 2,3-dioxygenase-like lactoylglutathione lyase family enzyme
MEPRIDLISIVTEDLDGMLAFYRDVMGFPVKLKLESYVEFESPGVRFAITTNSVMAKATGHASFSEGRKGQAFELAFPVETPEEVDSGYNELVGKGAVPVKSPEDMPWNQRAAFFADPDGNVHEIFAELE